MTNNLKQVAEAAVPLAKARPFLKDWDRTRYAAVFNKYGSGSGKDKFRIYIPLSAAPTFSQKHVEAPKWLVDHLATMGMTVDNYVAGTALMADGKRTIRIGKVLAREPGMKLKFDNDPDRQATKTANSWVVISRHPYDIIGMSFDRGWTSCMDLGEGSQKSHLKDDVKHGTIVAYLVKDTDKNINSPTARIAIKPYHGKEGVILIPGSVYGVAPESFAHVVSTFCRYMNSGAPTGAYKMPKQLYPDGRSVEEIHVHDDDSPLELSKAKRNSLAESPAISERISLQLALDRDYQTRYNLSKNPSVTSTTLTRVMETADDRIMYEMAENRNAAGPLLENLLRKGSYPVKENVSANPNLAQSTVDKILSGEIAVEPELIYHFVDTRLPSMDMVQQVVNKMVADVDGADEFTTHSAYGLVKSRKASPEMTRLFADTFINYPKLVETRKKIYHALLRNPGLRAEDMDRLMASLGFKSSEIQHAARNPNLSEQMIRYILANMSGEDFEVIVEQLIQLPNMPEEIALKIIREAVVTRDNADMESFYPLLAIQNPNATAAIWIAVYNCSPAAYELVKQVLENPNSQVPVEALAYFAREDARLCDYIAQHTATTDPILIGMINTLRGYTLTNVCMHTMGRSNLSSFVRELVVQTLINAEAWSELHEIGEAGLLHSQEIDDIASKIPPEFLSQFMSAVAREKLE